MSNEVQTSTQFQERLFAKIRDSIGELMTEQELKAIVEKTMQQLFFAPQTRVLNPGGYNRQTIEEPPAVQMLIKELLEPALRAQLKQWLADNPDVVQSALDKALQTGLADAVLRAINDMLANQFMNMKLGLQNALQQGLQR